MEFVGLDGKLVVLRGMHLYSPQTVSAHRMEVDLRNGEFEWVAELRIYEVGGQPKQAHPDIQSILDRLTNAPTTFQTCMNHVFHQKLRIFVLVFLDDILIYNITWEEHLQHLEVVLCILEEQQFYAKLSKCEFGLTRMLYLGHIIEEVGVRVHEENIRAIWDWSTNTKWLITY
eukprot:PITA_05712